MTQHQNSAREEAIAIEMVKNLREQVAWCQRKHPVTHYYDCAEIVGKYLKLVKVRALRVTACVGGGDAVVGDACAWGASFVSFLGRVGLLGALGSHVTVFNTNTNTKRQNRTRSGECACRGQQGPTTSK